jgi:hypothetical protein
VAIVVVYEVQCPHCLQPAYMRALHQPNAQGEIEIDVEVLINQSTYACSGCSCGVFVSDIEPMIIDEKCNQGDGDGEDGEDG